MIIFPFREIWGSINNSHNESADRKDTKYWLETEVAKNWFTNNNIKMSISAYNHEVYVDIDDAEYMLFKLKFI